jgi:hypothetical protein
LKPADLGDEALGRFATREIDEAKVEDDISRPKVPVDKPTRVHVTKGRRHLQRDIVRVSVEEA